MEITVFSSISTLTSGLFVGFIFGFLLRKALVTKFDIIVKQLLLQDFTVMKVILTAITIGSIGIYTLISIAPYYTLMISKTSFLSAAIGGGLFGIGMATMGYCPGTGIGALANGARDMWFGLAGMLAGAALYAELYPWITQQIKPTSALNTLTLPEFFHLSPWVFIAISACILGILAYWDRG